MPDFTSALYLGFRHPSTTLAPWSRISGGFPAAFREPTNAIGVAAEAAHLQGCDRAVVSTSTLHLFWDLFGILATEPVQIFFDAKLYAIGRWGIERAAGLGATAHKFRHLDSESLKAEVGKQLDSGTRPVVVTDGFCPDCGRAAPLRQYIKLIRDYAGLLVMDDTQALGIFGHSANRSAPYGRAGGGMLRWSGIQGPDIVVISSMAKGFGVPVAILSGSESRIREFRAKSQTRVHCSPPSIASIRAAQRAFLVNRKYGDRLRLRLASLVSQFRRGAGAAGFVLTGGVFPVQSLNVESSAEALRFHKQLLGRGIGTVLRKIGPDDTLRITFLINARHTNAEIDEAVAALRECAARRSVVRI